MLILAIVCLIAVIALSAKNLLPAHAATSFPNGYTIKITGTYPGATAYDFTGSEGTPTNSYISGCVSLSPTGTTIDRAKTSSSWQSVQIDIVQGCGSTRAATTILKSVSFATPSSVDTKKHIAYFTI